jgi:hypothetical protein
MSWEAKKWAEQQVTGDPNLKWVLFGACEYSNKRNGKIYASAATIAEFCNYKRSQSVSGWLKELARRGFLIDTGERQGRSLVWLPSYWAKSPTPIQQESNTYPTPIQHLSNDNVAPVIGEVGPNPITYNPEPRATGEFHTLRSSLNEEKRTGKAQAVSSFLVGNKESLKSDSQFEQFAAYCYSRGGEPTEEGFKTWKQTQANRHKGYVYNGKFLTEKQANEKAQKNHELLEEGRLRKATRINGKITIL